MDYTTICVILAAALVATTVIGIKIVQYFEPPLPKPVMPRWEDRDILDELADADDGLTDIWDDVSDEEYRASRDAATKSIVSVGERHRRRKAQQAAQKSRVYLENAPSWMLEIHASKSVNRNIDKHKYPDIECYRDELKRRRFRAQRNLEDIDVSLKRIDLMLLTRLHRRRRREK